MLITLDQIYFVTLPLATPAETDVLITARNTCTESLVGQVVKAARLQIHLRRAKKMWSGELSMFKALDRQGNEHVTLRRGLKPRSFSRLATSPTSYNRFRLAGVPASTHEPQVVRHTMLDVGRSAQCAHLPGFIPRQDIDLSHHITMRAETTPPAGIRPAAWFVPLGAVGTGLSRVTLVNQRDSDTFRFRFVGDVLADLAMVPLRGLLVVLLAMIDAIRDIPYIADRNRAREPLDSHIHHRPADLVLHVAHDALVFGAHAGSGSLQAPVAPAALPLGAERHAQFRQAFRVALLLVPPLATGDDRGLLFVACYRWVDLAKINRNNVCSWRHFRLFTVLDNQVPGVTVGPPVVFEPHFQHAQHIPEVLWQRESYRRQSLCPGQQQPLRLPANAALLPDSRAPRLALVRVLCAQMAVHLGNFARLVEAFLGRVFAMGVEQGRVIAGEIVVQALAGVPRQPVARASAALAIDAVVRDERAGIDRAAGPIEGVGLCVLEMTLDDVGTDHGCRTAATQAARFATGSESISNFAQPLYLQLPLPEAQLMLALLRSFDSETLYGYNPPRSAEAWGSIDALRALVAAMDTRWEAIITAALAVPAVALA